VKGRIQNIFLKFEDGAIFRGREYWFDAATAVLVLKEARSQGLSLLGFDAGLITDDATQPSLEFSKDYTAGRDRSVIDRYADAIENIGAKSNMDFRFTLVLSEPNLF
jgi:hypothetical protein